MVDDKPACSRTIVHVVTGDASATNGAALCLVLYYLIMHSVYKDFVQYRLMQLSCAAREANLVTVGAVCGQTLANPIEGDAICAALSRSYKYLTPQYCGDSLDTMTMIWALYAKNTNKYSVDRSW